MMFRRSAAMWRNYLLVALRTLARNKTYTFINVFGLALGLAACLTILLYVRYELSYDAWLPDAERVFQLQEWDAPGENAEAQQMTSFASGAALAKDFPEIERLVYVGNGQPVILQNGEASVSEHFVFVDGPLFDIIQLPFVHGDRRSALGAPGRLVLTESEALKRFGTDRVVGRTLTLVVAGVATDYRITGVVADPPRDSHLALSIVARYDPRTAFANQPTFLTQWMPKNGWVYVKLKPGVSAGQIMRRMPAWEKRNIPDDLVGGELSNPGESNDWKLVNVRDIHLGEAQRGSMTPGNDRRTIATFAAVGLLILTLAIVNFINLSTARASQRAREVALRKVLGARRGNLVAQFLGESLLMAGAAMLIALALVEAALPSVNAFLDAHLAAPYFGASGILLPALALVLLVGGAAGLYPAFFLSRFQPARVLRANRSAADGDGSGRLRNLLVVGQFAVSIGLIICTAVIYAQTQYARTADPGYRRDGLIQIGNIGRRAILPVVETLMNELRAAEGVVSLGRSTIGVDTFAMENMTVTPPGADESTELEVYRVDPGFFGTMGIRTLSGRTFVEGRAMDDSTVEGFPPDEAAYAALARRGYNVVLNEAAARLLGFTRPADAIGKVLKADDGDVEVRGQTPATIVGVVADSRFRSIRDPIGPMLFVYDRYQPSWLLVRYNGVPSAVRTRIERVWKRIAPDVPFEAEFADDIVRDLYAPDSARAQIFAAFSLLAVVIGSLGLYGLAAFTAERRTREIGIRKVLGARTVDIVRLLVWQFSRPVLVANVIAWPAAWWAMRSWLNGFDVRVDLGPGPFLVAGALALGVASATVAGQAFRVARTRPVHALRYE